MRRTRAIGVFGLVLVGITGCAGTHHHHHHASSMPGIPAAPPSQSGSPCGCEAHAHVHSPAPAPPVAVPPSRVAQARPTTVVATTATRPVPSPASSLPPSSRPMAVPAQPPSSRPVAVPAPSGVVRYLPMFDEPGTIVRSVWAAAPPDLLGVRTAFQPDGSLLPEPSLAPGDFDLAPPAPLPVNSGLPPAQSALPPPSQHPFPLLPGKTIPEQVGQLPPRSDVVPASVEVGPPGSKPAQAPPGPMLEVGPSAAGRPRTLGLEYANSGSLAGRPRWNPDAPSALPPQDPSGPSSWVSQLALMPPPTTAATAPPVRPVPREVVPAGRHSVVSRFVRRVRGAGRAFIDPGSLRPEAGHSHQLGEEVQRTSTSH